MSSILWRLTKSDRKTKRRQSQPIRWPIFKLKVSGWPRRPKVRDRVLSKDPRIILSSPLPDGTMTLWFEPDKCYLELPDQYRRKVRVKSGGRIALGVTHIDSGFITIYQNRALKLRDDYTVEVVIGKLLEMLLENAKKERVAGQLQNHSDA